MKNLLLTAIFLFISPPVLSYPEGGASLNLVFHHEVGHRLDVPQHEQTRYAHWLETALASAGVPVTKSQYVLLVDRSPFAQTIFVYWLDSQTSSERAHFIGASPISTGKPGKFDHFITPLGVFAHTLKNKDFRSEGTPNSLGIRALGLKGMRAYDFGWTQSERGWGRGGLGQMRLLMHTTDPENLERYLGIAMSKGCIRIPATLNTFIDRYGLLDDDYEREMAKGKKFWVIRPDRVPTPWPGRYLVIVDSGSVMRPAWSLDPVASTTAARVPAASAPAAINQ